MSEGVLRVGCPMWNNRDWVGRFLPDTTPSGGELAAYGKLLNAVEGNTTFYALPRPDSVRRWAAAVPEDFRFMFKLPRTITHDRRLTHVDDELDQFLRVLEPLFDRMQPTSIQLPASFGPESIGTLSRFLDHVPGTLRWAVEVRHHAFFRGDDERRLNDLLFDKGIDRIVLDSRALFAGPRTTPEEVEAFSAKPRVPVRAVATSDRPVVRFIGQSDEAANPAFWEPWIATVARWIADGRQPIVFLHTPDNVVAPRLARRFHAEVVAAHPGLRPLPDPPPVGAPALFE